MLFTLCSLKARVYIPRSSTKTCQARNFCHSSFTMARKGKRHAGDAEQSNGDVKKQKTEENSESKSFTERISDLRWKCAPSIADFKFNKKRVRVLSDVTDMPETNNGVVYWMSRDQRVQDNWAMLYAQRLAMKQEVPLHVCFCLLPKFLDATKRHFMFMLKGLKEVEKELTELDITFHLLKGEPEEVLPELVTENKFGGVVVDFSPLRTPRKWLDGVVKKLSKSVPICQVDSHNVVPCWVASEKLEYGARTIRPKITKVLPTYLTEFPPVIKHPHQAKSKKESVDWDDAGSSIDVDEKICEVDWAVPGYAEGIKTMESFVLERLMLFNSKRNDPTIDALSNISPWLHFGQVGAQRCILIAKQFRSKYKDSVDSFIEEAVVRRELADNFCYYNEHYDSVEGANDWAKRTLKDHAKDKREYVYTRQKLEDSKTHDDLWNAAQTQLVLEGKMHGFLRMYWAKKILEWTNSPEEALEFAIYLNDKYSMDGRDPNGYVGCMWSICGTHDQGWAERPVFGKIRYMNYNGCKRKFDVDTFVRKYKKMR